MRLPETDHLEAVEVRRAPDAIGSTMRLATMPVQADAGATAKFRNQHAPSASLLIGAVWRWLRHFPTRRHLKERSESPSSQPVLPVINWNNAFVEAGPSKAQMIERSEMAKLMAALTAASEKYGLFKQG
jgi:hypothetical protein